MSEICVFLGPSLGLDVARAALPSGRFEPPAAHGDVLRAARTASTIVLIDGLFEGVQSVWHKEILWALDQGVRVIGAASMGALRAAECAVYGMEPVGRIATDYVTGRRTKDSDVALAHGGASDGWRALSEPLVNVEATLEAAARESVLDESTSQRLGSIAGEQFYAVRTWRSIGADAVGRGVITKTLRDALFEWLPAGRVNQKGEDAIAALVAATQSHAPRERDWHLASTVFLRSAIATTSVDMPHDFDGLLDELRLDASEHRTVVLAANSRAFAGELALRAGVSFGEEALSETLSDLLEQMGVRSHDGVGGWVEAQGLTEASLRDLLAGEAAARWASEATSDRQGVAIVRYLQVEGRAAQLGERARHKHEVLLQHGYDDAAVEMSATDIDAIAWLFKARNEPFPVDLGAYLSAHRYRSIHELAGAARRERLYQSLMQSSR